MVVGAIFRKLITMGRPTLTVRIVVEVEGAAVGVVVVVAVG